MCDAQAPLIDSIKTLNILANDLHSEAKSIRSEICELYDRFDDSQITDIDCERRKQLLELSKYVKILEYRKGTKLPKGFCSIIMKLKRLIDRFLKIARFSKNFGKILERKFLSNF